MKNRSRLQVLNDNLYQKYFDNTGKATSKQIVVRDSIIDKIISTLHENPLKGHHGASKTLQVLRPRYYAPDLTRKDQDYIDNCQIRIRAKPCSNTKLRPRLEEVYDDVMEINHVGELPASKTYTHILTVCDVFSRYFFAVPLRQPSTSAVTHVLLQNPAQHAYVPKHILTDKRSAFTSQT